MADNSSQLVAAQMAYDNEKKNPLIAWLLWWFFGGFGGHRFYLGQVGRGLIMAGVTLLCLLLTIVLIFPALIPAIMVIVDAFLLPGALREKNAEIQHQVFARYGLNPQPVGSPMMQQQVGYQQPQQLAAPAPEQYQAQPQQSAPEKHDNA